MSVYDKKLAKQSLSFIFISEYVDISDNHQSQKTMWFPSNTDVVAFTARETLGTCTNHFAQSY